MNRSREYPIRTDVVFQPNKFQAYHFKPLSQFSFYFVFFFLVISMKLLKKKLPQSSKRRAGLNISFFFANICL
jgi:hypothetical protein